MKWAINIEVPTGYNESTYSSSLDKFCTVANDLKFRCLWYSANYHNAGTLQSVASIENTSGKYPIAKKCTQPSKIDQTDPDPICAGQGVVRWTTLHWEGYWIHDNKGKSETLYHELDTISRHYNDAIISAMASQITSLTSVYSTVYSGEDQRKHQSSTSLVFVRGIHRWPVICLNSRHLHSKFLLINHR